MCIIMAARANLWVSVLQRLRDSNLKLSIHPGVLIAALRLATNNFLVLEVERNLLSRLIRTVSLKIFNQSSKASSARLIK